MFGQLGRKSSAAWAPVHVEFRGHAWVPAADVYQFTSGWIVKLDLAGVREDDVEVSIEGNSILVTGRRLDWLAREGGRCHSLEITYDRFERRIELPRHLDHYQVGTEYRDGMLLVKIFAEEPR